MKGDLKEIRALLNARIGELCRHLLPAGRLEGGQWVVRNPRVAGEERRTPTLKIRVAGGDAGAWTDWRNGRDGYAGDAIGLIAYLNATDTKGALAIARDFLGLRAMSREQRDAMRFAAEAAQKKAEAKARKDRARKIMRAGELFAEAERLFAPGMAQNPAARHGLAYWAARKMPFDQIPALALENFRFSAATEWWKGAEWKREGERVVKIKDGPRFPAIHAAMRVWNGEIMACHCTFLDPVKAAKAPVDLPKLMLGEARGAVIELAQGPEQKPFWQARQAHPVILAEGIETAGPLAIAIPEARVWAVGSISGFAHAPGQLDCVSEIYVARDNNEGNDQAEAQIAAALAALEAHGKPVAVMASHVGDDFNDLA